MKKLRTQKEIAIDLGLDKGTLRLMQQARDFFGVEELNEETAIIAAQKLRELLNSEQKEVRLVTQARLYTLMDDLATLSDRLRTEQSIIAKKVNHQGQNKHANLAYVKGAF